MIRSLVCLVAVPLLVAVAPVAARDLPVYTDGPRNAFQDSSCGGGSNVANAAPTQREGGDGQRDI